jgi:hypothetical protein
MLAMARDLVEPDQSLVQRSVKHHDGFDHVEVACHVGHRPRPRCNPKAFPNDDLAGAQSTSPDSDSSSVRDAGWRRKRHLDDIALRVKTVKEGSSRSGEHGLLWET